MPSCILRRPCSARRCGQLPEPEDDCSERDDGGVVARRLLVAGGDATELLELGKAALDQMPLLVEVAVERVLASARRVVWDNGLRARVGDHLAQTVAVVG